MNKKFFLASSPFLDLDFSLAGLCECRILFLKDNSEMPCLCENRASLCIVFFQSLLWVLGNSNIEFSKVILCHIDIVGHGLVSLDFARDTRLVNPPTCLMHIRRIGGLPRASDERSEERVEWTSCESVGTKLCKKFTPLVCL